MSILSRLILSSQRFASTKHRCPNLIVRHFKPKRPEPSKKLPKHETIIAEPSPAHPFNGAESETNLFKYFIYTAAFVPSVFVGCMIWQYETFRAQTAKRFRRLVDAKKEFGVREHLNSYWNQLGPGKKVLIGIIATNLVVFGLWRYPNLDRMMSKYFLCLPVKGVSALSATLSGFSHQNTLHLVCNLYVLWSFAVPLMGVYSPEQVVAVYLSGMTISALMSSLFKVTTHNFIPSIGASGGVMTLIAVVCYLAPDSRVSIAFVDQIIPHSFSASSAIKGVMLFDFIGLIFRWRIIDHAAHLGGALFGLFYAVYGKSLIWDNYRKPILKWWHDMRNRNEV